MSIKKQIISNAVNIIKEDKKYIIPSILDLKHEYI